MLEQITTRKESGIRTFILRSLDLQQYRIRPNKMYTWTYATPMHTEMDGSCMHIMSQLLYTTHNE